MSKAWKMLLSAAVLLAVAACASPEKEAAAPGEDEPLQVVTSFSILTDMVQTIGQDRVEVHNLVPIGTDPHEYEPLPDDIKATTDADLLFYNGLNLEGGEDGWFFRLSNSTGQDPENVFEAAADVEPRYLIDEDGREEVNPHAFLDPVVGMAMAENIRDALISLDPGHSEDYTANAEAFLGQLEEINASYEETIEDIPADRRILITSERAFQYMADRYGLDEGYIWAVDTDENGSPAQIKSLVDFVRDHDVPGLFVESNVDVRPMETVSNETGVPIEGVLFSDEIGKPGEEGDTYLTFLTYNIEVIGEVLGQH